MTSLEVPARDRIVRAAATLLVEGGREAVTTRAVARAAGVQAPTIYRQFGDMRGVLDAAASYHLAAYLGAQAARVPADDPVDDLRRGWDMQVEFGSTHPAVHGLMYGDPRPGPVPTAARVARDILRHLVTRVAEAGRLRTEVDRATDLVHSACCGVTLTLIRTPAGQRDAALSTLTREAVVRAVATDTVAARAPRRVDRPVRHAVALRAVLPEVAADLTAAERELLTEWLDRIVHAAPPP
ncbi:TetR/AcrR family transcriptional regulator [Micromonospora sagamiensis]|uniref:TetR family transcriptional regulator n=1 Tax=Micromonospora sagamiensis TaxID=47875 RepID=A0A562WFL8_9ACTN|nr:TetR/AcrR family transcriptional regulator [Micromonospora sagamiensis]TWJ28861.1 TetR family transcriptional regulator [Micromonospora sagamiensis]BCL18112.1 TetR family transcriptional regulator [Micromonospora sagamiensis]